MCIRDSYSSYRGLNTTGVVREIMPVQADVKGRTLILLEDIIDTGYTMQFVMDKLRNDGAADVKLATMLFKPDSLKCDLKPDYVGLQIPCLLYTSRIGNCTISYGCYCFRLSDWLINSCLIEWHECCMFIKE